MRLFIGILVCKILKFIGGLVGKGSSLPGKIALKLYPDILSKVKFPEYVIAVTGSNGKTTTVEMIAHVLEENGKKIAYNREGSNQTEGAATLILSDCTFGGRMKSEILLLESDERYAKYTFNYFAPTHYVITNLYRDQLTRNGHPQWVFNAVKDSIKPSTKLILNADDPLVSLFGEGKDGVIWFGADRFSGSCDGVTGVYNDGYYCPRCGGKMEYEYAHYNHIGKFFCENCGYKRHDADFTVTDADLKNSVVTVNGKDKISLSFGSLYNVYNLLAAYTVCSVVGISGDKTAKSLNNYVLHNGRVVEFKIGGRSGVLLTSKHENSVSYDQSIRYAVNCGEDCDVLIIVDAISRKYFTADVSWIWDVDFGQLAAENIRNIVLSGNFANDLMSRFSYTEIAADRIKVIPDINEAVKYISDKLENRLFTITCFSDKDKFLTAPALGGHENGN